MAEPLPTLDPTCVHLSPHATREQARRLRRVRNERKRMRRHRAALQRLRSEQNELLLDRDAVLATTRLFPQATRDRLDPRHDRYLELVEEAERLLAANQAMAHAIERWERYSTGVHASLLSSACPVCVDLDARGPVTVVLLTSTGETTEAETKDAVNLERSD